MSDTPTPKKPSGLLRTLKWVAVNVLVPVAVAAITKNKPAKND